MRKRLLVAAVVFVVVALSIQLVPVRRTEAPVVADLVAPVEVKAVLRSACYDCHSNQTRWPWYSHVAPVSWLVASDVAEAHRKFNFSVWGTYEPLKQARLKEAIWEEVSKGEMPPATYRLMHPQARLSDSARTILHQWSTAGPPGD